MVVTPINLGMAKAFLLQGERAVLVDTGIAGTSKRLLAKLAALGIEPRDLALIVITHAHSDHTGGLSALLKQASVPVAVHRLDADALRNGMSIPLTAPGFRGRLLRLLSPAGERPRMAGVEPAVVIDDELDLKPYGVDARVIATPGHTAGSVSVIAGSEALVGDLVGALFGNRPSIMFWAWSREQSLVSLRRVLGLKPDIIRTTHGGPYTPAQLAQRFGI